MCLFFPLSLLKSLLLPDAPGFNSKRSWFLLSCKLVREKLVSEKKLRQERGFLKKEPSEKAGLYGALQGPGPQEEVEEGLGQPPPQ